MEQYNTLPPEFRSLRLQRSLTARGEKFCPLCVEPTLRRNMAALAVRQYRLIPGKVNLSDGQYELAVTSGAEMVETAGKHPIRWGTGL